MNSFLVFKPKGAIPTAKELSEETVEMLDPTALYLLLREILPDIGEPDTHHGDGRYIDYRFGEAPVEIILNKGCIGLSTYTIKFPDVCELIRQLRARGLVVFDTMTGQFVSD